jgi:hypothetical protein
MRSAIGRNVVSAGANQEYTATLNIHEKSAEVYSPTAIWASNYEEARDKFIIWARAECLRRNAVKALLIINDGTSNLRSELIDLTS